MTDFLFQDDEARKWFPKALELDPENADIANDYATFLWQVDGKYIETDWLYRTALRLDPHYAFAAGNYGGFLLSYEQLDETTKNIDRAKSLNRGKTNQLAAELAFYEAIIIRIKKQDATNKIQELENLLSKGFDRHAWRPDPVLALVRKTLSAADYDLFLKLAVRIPKLRRLTKADQRRYMGGSDTSTDRDQRS